MSHHSQINENESTSEREFIRPVEDEEESANIRLYMHNIYEEVFGGKVGAPVQENLQNGAKVLELCCEDGIWITEVAAEYPNTEFYGVDSNIQNSDNNFNNVTFIECNIFKKLPFPDNEFDYIFAKDKILYMEKNTFLKVLSEILRVLKPGGWLEILCSFNTEHVYGPAYTRLRNTWESWLEVQNIDKDLSLNLENYLKQTGKTGTPLCRTKDSQVGCGNAFGEFLVEFLLFFYRTARDYLAAFMNISLEEFDDLVNKAENELSKESRTTMRHKQVLARKMSMHSEEIEAARTMSSAK
ncbi:6695_t:CDS:2 [Cetraspora pellucida]|uniref:6695_t:CDS:1 n=1 Tax=Cetraspora pellucida TaxID=1433469 RepID=A0A9N9AM26_9GLOM|nr:6695_t:CDS:2 [Cetraspora pellucida]